MREQFALPVTPTNPSKSPASISTKKPTAQQIDLVLEDFARNIAATTSSLTSDDLDRAQPRYRLRRLPHRIAIGATLKHNGTPLRTAHEGLPDTQLAQDIAKLVKREGYPTPSSSASASPPPRRRRRLPPIQTHRTLHPHPPANHRPHPADPPLQRVPLHPRLRIKTRRPLHPPAITPESETPSPPPASSRIRLITNKTSNLNYFSSMPFSTGRLGSGTYGDAIVVPHSGHRWLKSPTSE